MSVNDRIEALNILVRVVSLRQPLVHAFAASKSIKPFTKELCFGVCRHFYRLNTLLEVLQEKKTKNERLRLCLILGLYQLQYTHKPEYAVVKESVAMLDKLKLGWAKGLMNGLLREFIRSREEILASLQDNVAFCYGQPEWILKRWQEDWPEYWQDIASAQDAHPPMSLRVNQKKISTSEYLHCLEKAGLSAKAHSQRPTALILDSACSVEKLPGFKEGLVSVQDVAAQYAADLLLMEEGMRVLDACCAPGGKTCHILEQASSPAECLAIDVDARRMQKVEANLERLQLHAHLQVADALHPEYWWDGHLFDRILLDAPCSASGVIRRQPDIRLLRTPEEVNAAAALQKQLLYALWPLLKPGGRLLYATCSIFKSENEQQIAEFLLHHLDAACEPLQLEVGHGSAFGWQFLPGEADMDGFFYSRIVKKM